MLAHRDFRVFYAGFATSLFGTSMASVALAFAVLDGGGSLTGLGAVMTARILPLVAGLLGGGLLGDRLPRRRVMLAADLLRAGAQAGIAALFLGGGFPPMGLLLALSAASGIGEALFSPSLEGLVPELAPAGSLQDANSLLGLARSAATVGGPAVAGLLVAAAGPAAVLAVDAASYLASVASLLLLRIPGAARQAGTGVLRDLRDGWELFRSRTWLWALTLQGALFNLAVWAHFLVLGPAAARADHGGAGAWEAVMALYGAGSAAGGLAMLGRSPSRPLAVSTAAAFGWGAPSACLALHAPFPVLAAGALAAGAANAVGGTLGTTTVQQQVPAEALSRVMSYVYVGAFALGPLGLAAAGPLAERAGIGTVLAAGAAWQTVSTAAVLALPSVRRMPAGEPADARR
ncbi:MFS transporter [Streptomyces sp. NPDC001380]|uniref:MFS transporter n=1 Tax=Streptomyces sp. NPDC001380 TaxID=3364566 RepID=UPI00367A0CDD